MRWLADENIARQSIVYLRSRGEDVVSVSEVAPNIPDRAVIELARLDHRILLSFDRDHGELIFRHGVVPPRSVVYLRLEPPDPEFLNRVLDALIALGQSGLDGQFVTVNKTGIRQRPLPSVA
jgi:predicted nuclease of predicted toxin-antitoxin system